MLKAFKTFMGRLPIILFSTFLV